MIAKLTMPAWHFEGLIRWSAGFSSVPDVVEDCKCHRPFFRIWDTQSCRPAFSIFFCTLEDFCNLYIKLLKPDRTTDERLRSLDRSPEKT